MDIKIIYDNLMIWIFVMIIGCLMLFYEPWWILGFIISLIGIILTLYFGFILLNQTLAEIAKQRITKHKETEASKN